MLELKISRNHRSLLVHKDLLFQSTRIFFLTNKKRKGSSILVPQGTFSRSCKTFSRSSQARSTPLSHLRNWLLWQPVYVVLKLGIYSPFSHVPMIAFTNPGNRRIFFKQPFLFESFLFFYRSHCSVLVCLPQRKIQSQAIRDHSVEGRIAQDMKNLCLAQYIFRFLPLRISQAQ